MPSRSAFFKGVRDVLPLLVGYIPFGIITGLTAVGIGMSPREIITMSAVMFSGAAQLAAIDLIADSAPIAVIVTTALIINLRFSMFSAAIAPHLRSLSHSWKAISGFLLTVPSFVLSTATFENDDSISRQWYYLGTASPIWIVWVLSTALGASIGSYNLPELQLDFIIPLVFIVLLFKLLDDRATWITAIVAGVLAPIVGLVPLNLGLILASLGAVLAGLFIDRWWFA